VTSSDPHNLQRFVDAQATIFETALSQLRSGRKQSHWMWFIFPQMAGLGRSPTAQFYGIASLEEADAYLAHPLLGPRLRQAVEALQPWAGKRNSEEILGPVDAMKLRSSLTLFDRTASNDIFAHALDGFFDGEGDERTLALLNAGG
jgi:uncharacterized protein (DUF1810 family)